MSPCSVQLQNRSSSKPAVSPVGIGLPRPGDDLANQQFILRSKIAETIQKSTKFLSWFSPPENHYLLGNSINYTQDVVSCAAGQYKTLGPKVKPWKSENFVPAG